MDPEAVIGDLWDSVLQLKYFCFLEVSEKVGDII